MKFLIIDDAPGEVRATSLYLQTCYPNATFLSASDGRMGLDLARRENPDMVILEQCLQDPDGFEICSQIHFISQVPIIMLAEGDSDSDMAHGLEIGADDYITRPFSCIEFLARVQAVMRRTRSSHNYLNGDLIFNHDTREVLVKDKRVRLTGLESRLLEQLVLNTGQVLTKQELVSKVWGKKFARKTRRLNVHIKRLRQKLGDSESLTLISTEPGVGYKFIGTTKGHGS